MNHVKAPRGGLRPPSHGPQPPGPGRPRTHREKGTTITNPETLDKIAEVADTALAVWADHIGTHYDGCWQRHTGCLAALVGRLARGEDVPVTIPTPLPHKSDYALAAPATGAAA